MRDALIGDVDLDVVDIDLTTEARPEEILDIVRGWADAVWEQGSQFGTIGLRKARPRLRDHDAPRRGLPRGLAQARRSRSATTSRRTSPRRDFTINAMALDLATLTLVDPFGGAVDLAQRRLATPLDPEVSFSDDPLRMLRAARFIARFDLVPDDVLVESARSLADRLSIVSAERIRDELDKIMLVATPSVALWFIVRTGLADHFFPELPGLALEQDPIQRHKDVLAHTFAVVDKTSEDRLLRLAALFHDIGKPRTRAFGPGGVSFHHHEIVGASMTRVRMEALRYPTDEMEIVTKLVELHLRFHTYKMGWTDRAVRRYVRDAGRAPRTAERAHEVRLHHAQRAQRAGARTRAWTSSRRGSPSCRSARRCWPCGRTSTGPR